MVAHFVLVIALLSVGCSTPVVNPTAPSSPAAETSLASPDVSLVLPRPQFPPAIPVLPCARPDCSTAPAAPTSPAAPAPTPASSVEVAPCSIIQPPAPGSAKVLLCVTYREDGELEPAGGADVIFNGVKQGITDPNGQFMLRIRGYGGTANVSIEYPAYSNSPVRFALPLHEEIVTWNVDMGVSIR